MLYAQVLYANAHNLSFLAYSGGHGAISSLAKVTNGIEISMRQMNSIAIAPDGQSVTIGGGAKVKEVTHALAAAGKRTGWSRLSGLQQTKANHSSNRRL